MNYIITASLIVLFAISGKAQSDSTSFGYKLLTESEDKSVSVYGGIYTDYNLTTGESEETEYFYGVIMVVNSTNDTCEIISLDYYAPAHIDSMEIKSIVLDKTLRKGILLTLHLYQRVNYGEHGDYEIHKTVNEIWDLKTRKKIFSATNKFHFTADYYSYFEVDSSSTTTYTDYAYTYDFYFISTQILIHNIKIECKEKYNDEAEWTSKSEVPVGFDECQLPEHVEGVYTYHKGVYMLEKLKDSRRNN